MQFSNNNVTEIVAPTGVPFAPGEDVIGFGTDVPPALAAAGIPAAILFFNSGYSPTNTWPSVKYAFIGSFSGVTTGPGGAALGGIVIGMGIVTNPSVSEQEVVKFSSAGVMISATSTPFDPELAWEQLNYTQTGVVAVMTHGTAAGGGGDTPNGLVETFNSSGTSTGHLP